MEQTPRLLQHITPLVHRQAQLQVLTRLVTMLLIIRLIQQLRIGRWAVSSPNISLRPRVPTHLLRETNLSLHTPVSISPRCRWIPLGRRQGLQISGPPATSVSIVYLVRASLLVLPLKQQCVLTFIFIKLLARGRPPRQFLRTLGPAHLSCLSLTVVKTLPTPCLTSRLTPRAAIPTSRRATEELLNLPALTRSIWSRNRPVTVDMACP